MNVISINEDLDSLLRAMQAYALLTVHRAEVGDGFLLNAMRFLRFYYVHVITGYMPSELSEAEKQQWLDVLDTGDLAATAIAELAKEGLSVGSGVKS